MVISSTLEHPRLGTTPVKASILHERFNGGLLSGVTPSWFGDRFCLENTHSEAIVAHGMVSKGCRVGASTLETSTLLKDAVVGNHTSIQNCLVGQRATIGNHCTLEGVIVDHDAHVPDGTTLHGGQWPMENTRDGSRGMKPAKC